MFAPTTPPLQPDTTFTSAPIAPRAQATRRDALKSAGIGAAGNAGPAPRRESRAARADDPDFASSLDRAARRSGPEERSERSLPEVAPQPEVAPSRKAEQAAPPDAPTRELGERSTPADSPDAQVGSPVAVDGPDALATEQAPRRPSEQSVQNAERPTDAEPIVAGRASTTPSGTPRIANSAQPGAAAPGANAPNGQPGEHGSAGRGSPSAAAASTASPAVSVDGNEHPVRTDPRPAGGAQAPSGVSAPPETPGAARAVGAQGPSGAPELAEPGDASEGAPAESRAGESARGDAGALRIGSSAQSPAALQEPNNAPRDAAYLARVAAQGASARDGANDSAPAPSESTDAPADRSATGETRRQPFAVARAAESPVIAEPVSQSFTHAATPASQAPASPPEPGPAQAPAATQQATTPSVAAVQGEVLQDRQESAGGRERDEPRRDARRAVAGVSESSSAEGKASQIPGQAALDARATGEIRAGSASPAQGSSLTGGQAGSATEDAALASIQRGLSVAMKQQGGSVQMRLTPESLGLLKIEMTLARGVVAATLQASTPEARELLTRNIETLRASLEAKGLSVERLSITLAPASQGGLSGQHSGTGTGSQHQQPGAQHAQTGERGAEHDASGERSRGWFEREQRRSHARPDEDAREPDERLFRYRFGLHAIG